MRDSCILPFLERKFFVSRISRKCMDGNYFHIMIQGHNKAYIFSKKKYKNKIKEIIFKKTKGLNIGILAYCIMDNHLHLILKIARISDLSKYMAKVNTSYAKYYNHINNIVGYVFRDRYRAEGIYSINQLINCIKYIHENPVKAHIVPSAKDYYYSSIHDYENNKIEDDILIEAFGDDINYLDKVCGVYEDYNFLDEDDEFGEGEKEEFSEVIKEYKDVDYSVDENVYKISKILKKRCDVTNEEIYSFMGLKKTSYYTILRIMKKLDF